MACKCVEKLEKLLGEKYGDGYLDANVQSPSEAIIRYYYHRRKKLGGEEVRERTVPVIASYCPMCGKKYTK